MKIGIIGFGTVGQALYQYYEGKHEVWTYDKAIDREGSLDELNKNADVVFICVDTPYKGMDEGLDCQNVYDAVAALTGSKTVIIKSTVNPGTTDAIQAKYPQHRVFFVPEFLSADTAAEDYARPRREVVIGMPYQREATFCALDNRVWELSPKYMGSSIYESDRYIHDPMILPALQAELLKLATNSYYALKVTFANQMYDLGMTQETLDALAADPWIQPSHFTVEHKGGRGAGGKCLPKDLKALNDYQRQECSETEAFIYSLLTMCDLYNASLLRSGGKK